MVLMRLGLWLAALVLGVNWVDYLVQLYRQSRFDPPRLLISTGLGFGLLTAVLIARPLRTAIPPLSSRVEIFALFSASILGIYCWLALIDELKPAGSLVVPTALLFLGLALLQPVEPAGATGPSGGVVWPHVLLIVTAYGAFTVGFLMAVGYLRAEYQLRAKSVDGTFFVMPSLEALDRGLRRSLWIGVVLLAGGVILAIGAGYGRGELSMAWFVDRNVLGAILTGVVYGMILYFRSRTLFTNRRIAYLAIAGFVLISSLFIGMNVFADMHRFLD